MLSAPFPSQSCFSGLSGSVVRHFVSNGKPSCKSVPLIKVIDLALVQAACLSLLFPLSPLPPLPTSSHFSSQYPSQERWFLLLQVNVPSSLSEA